MTKKRSPAISKMPIEIRTPMKWHSRIKCPTLLHGLSEEESNKEIERQKWLNAMDAATQEIHKLKILFKHYNIDDSSTDAWQELSIRLARDTLPGFQIEEKEKRGRKNVWHHGTLLALWVDVHDKMIEKNCKARSACSMLLTQEKWKRVLVDGKANKQGSVVASKQAEMLKTLYNRYEESKKSAFVLLVQHLPKDGQLPSLKELCEIIGDPTKMTFDE